MLRIAPLPHHLMVQDEPVLVLDHAHRLPLQQLMPNLPRRPLRQLRGAHLAERLLHYLPGDVLMLAPARNAQLPGLPRGMANRAPHRSPEQSGVGLDAEGVKAPAQRLSRLFSGHPVPRLDRQSAHPAQQPGTGPRLDQGRQPTAKHRVGMQMLQARKQGRDVVAGLRINHQVLNEGGRRFPVAASLSFSCFFPEDSAKMEQNRPFWPDWPKTGRTCRISEPRNVTVSPCT